ncbi:MAG: hypothetical protein EAZ57_11295 [Cytophagales bacterium]|nr:MAG: hypothetical protein EAZ67_12230 [Cytophagales bacterium]TAF59399.1 MAG: hypothetical protein EAZ57_11295 [Cytophagales bacterium]
MRSQEYYNLKNYSDKILDLQKSYHDYPLSEQDLKQLAFQMGMDEEDWLRIQRTLKAHLERGQGYCRYFNWEDAIAEFKQVITLNPNHVEALYGLSLAYKNIWLDSRQLRHQDRAFFYAKKCLMMNPKHDAALRLISDLKLLSSNTQLTLKQKVASISLASVLFAMVIGVAVVLLGVDGQIQTNMNKADAQQLITARAVEVQHVKAQQLPVQFMESSPKMNLEVEQSSLRIFEDALSYELKASLSIQEKAVSSLKVQLELLDAKNNVLLSELIDALRLTDSPAQKGDVLPFRVQDFYKDTELEANKIASVRLSVVDAVLANNVLVSKPIEVDLKAVSNPKVSLRFAERDSKLSKSEFSDQSFHRLVLEVQNNGLVPVHELVVDLCWFDAHQELIMRKRVSLIDSMDAALKPNQIITRSHVVRLPQFEASKALNYRLVVCKAQ